MASVGEEEEGEDLKNEVAEDEQGRREHRD